MSPAGLTHNIYLMSSIDNPNIAGKAFDDIAAAANVSCVALKLTDELQDDPSRAVEIIRSVQARNIAVIINGSVDIAREMGADGVHLNPGMDLKADYLSARSTLGEQAIVGVEIGSSRHDAMVLAEQGASYVAFSDRSPEKEGNSANTMPEMILWWSDLFEIPCVAFADSEPASVQDYLRAGADFIAIDLDELSDGVSTYERLVELFSAIDEVTAVA